MPGQGLGSPLPRPVLVAGPAGPARLAHGIHSGPQAGHTGPPVWDREQDRNSEVPFLQADRLRLCVTKSQQRLCLRAGATALPWALCFSRANHRFCPHDHHPPAAPSSHLLATLTDFGLSSPPIPTLGLSPTQDVPWGQESSPQGRLGQQAPLPWAPALGPGCLPRKGQALHGSTRPSQPTASGSFSQYSSRPLPEKLPSGGTGAPVLPDQPFTCLLRLRPHLASSQNAPPHSQLWVLPTCQDPAPRGPLQSLQGVRQRLPTPGPLPGHVTGSRAPSWPWEVFLANLLFWFLTFYPPELNRERIMPSGFQILLAALLDTEPSSPIIIEICGDLFYFLGCLLKENF